MTSANDTIPNPSHPSRSAGRLGIKIKRFIDKTKSITNQVNRLKNGSLAMYLEEKIITAPEIKQTIPLNLRPWGSKITITVI